MKIEIGGMTADLPDGWQDRSSIIFEMPDDEELRDPRALQKQTGHTAANISLNWDDASDEISPDKVLRAQLEQLPASLPGFSIVEQGRTEEGWPFAETRFDLGMIVRQLLCVRPVGDKVVVLTAAASEPLYAGVKTKAESTLRSLAVKT